MVGAIQNTTSHSPTPHDPIHNNKNMTFIWHKIISNPEYQPSIYLIHGTLDHAANRAYGITKR
jgi:hypothetical protein